MLLYIVFSLLAGARTGPGGDCPVMILKTSKFRVNEKPTSFKYYFWMNVVELSNHFLRLSVNK